jgi:hypothetical protein
MKENEFFFPFFKIVYIAQFFHAGSSQLFMNEHSLCCILL